MPPVRELQSLIAEQQQAIAPQKALIDQSIEQNAASGAAQEAGLAATQKKAFGNIEQAAQNKGMFFSGFSPDQQAEYTSSTYLPALAQLQATIAGTRSQLLGKKADLDLDVFKTATGMRENDMQVLRSWEKMTAEQQFNASEADKQRVFTAQQNEAARQAQAREGAANRYAASQANAGPSAAERKQADVAAATGFFRSVAGGDKFVHQQDYAQAKKLWTGMGYSAGEFDQQFADFRNPENNMYKLGG